MINQLAQAPTTAVSNGTYWGLLVVALSIILINNLVHKLPSR